MHHLTSNLLFEVVHELYELGNKDGVNLNSLPPNDEHFNIFIEKLYLLGVD